MSIEEIRKVLADYMPHNTIEDTISDIEDYGTYRENIGKDLGREEREEEIVDLIYFFEKTWNKESHKRVSHVAISELVEFIMQNDTSESVERWVKEQKNDNTN